MGTEKYALMSGKGTMCWIGYNAEWMSREFPAHPWPETDRTNYVCWRAGLVPFPFDELSPNASLDSVAIADPVVLAAFGKAGAASTYMNTCAFRIHEQTGKLQVGVHILRHAPQLFFCLQICNLQFTFGTGLTSDVYIPRALRASDQQIFTDVCAETVEQIARRRGRNVLMGKIKTGTGKVKAARMNKSTHKHLGGVLWGMQSAGYASVMKVGKQLVLGEKFDSLVNDAAVLSKQLSGENMQLGDKQQVQYYPKLQCMRLVSSREKVLKPNKRDVMTNNRDAAAAIPKKNSINRSHANRQRR